MAAMNVTGWSLTRNLFDIALTTPIHIHVTALISGHLAPHEIKEPRTLPAQQNNWPTIQLCGVRS